MLSRASLLAVVLGLALLAAPAMAQDNGSDGPPHDEPQATPGFVLLQDRAAGLLAAGFGAALVIMGGGGAISRVGANAVESMARQPEASGSINGVAVILAAMIEGATLFAVVVCLLVALSS